MTDAFELSLVSVIIPVHNTERFIKRTLKSVVAQTYSNLEILVIDDGSDDSTVDIVKQFAKEDKRIRLLQQPNGGVAAARNLGIQASVGEFIAPIDADDIWHPDNVIRQIDAMQRGGPETGLVYSWSVDIDEHDEATGGFRAAQISGDVYITLIAHNFIGNASATMLRRRCLTHVGDYDSSLRTRGAQGCEDWDLYLRIAEHYQFQVVPEFLVGYRKLSSSMSCNYSVMAKSHSFVMASVQQRHASLPKYIFRLSASNLFMYFAHQSKSHKEFDNTFNWLINALKLEPFTTLIRIGFYRLLIISAWQKLYPGKSFKSSIGLLCESSEMSESESENFMALSFKPSSLVLALMLFVGDTFHRLLYALIKPKTYKLIPSSNYCATEDK